MNKELTEMLKYLRLGNLLAHWDDYLKLAADKNFSHARLYPLLEEDINANARTPGNSGSSTPACPRSSSWNLSLRAPAQAQQKAGDGPLRLPGLHAATTRTLSGWALVAAARPAWRPAFLIHAIDQGYRGRYVLFADLINELYAAVADHSENRVLKKYLAFDCSLIDELGYVEVEPVQVGLFFTLMHERHKKKPTLITSNLGFAEWGSFLKNDHLTAALIDRLTENSHVINMRGCKSLRSPLDTEPCAEP